MSLVKSMNTEMTGYRGEWKIKTFVLPPPLPLTKSNCILCCIKIPLMTTKHEAYGENEFIQPGKLHNTMSALTNADRI